MQFTITLVIVIITSLVSIGGFSNQKIIDDLIFYPPAITQRRQWYRFFSCGLIHADTTHLVFNMFSLYVFGVYVEKQFIEIFAQNGKMLYLGMYVLALMVSLLPTFIKHKNDYHYRSLGASGAVSAVIFAGLLIAPYMEVGLFILPPFIPGFIFAPLYLVASIMMERRGKDNVNHSAHIWGALFGLAFVVIMGKLLADYDAITQFVEGVKFWFRHKGWM